MPDQSCAVTLCNEIVRSQFNNLFFVDFPLNNPVLCDTWWKACGRSGEFDPSLKICSIHFYSSDFKVIAKEYNNQLYRQYVLKNKNTVPSLYLLSHEYTKFSKKRKKCIDSNNSEYNHHQLLHCLLFKCLGTDNFTLSHSATCNLLQFHKDNIICIKKNIEHN